MSELMSGAGGASREALAGGLPAYTMPPSGPATAAPRPAEPPRSAPVSGQPTVYQSTGSWPTVVPAGGPEPSATPVAPTSGGALYGGVPQQRGTVYGAGQPAELTMAVPTPPSMEHSGSLTGHILSQGWTEINQHTTRNNRRVVVIMAVVLLSLVAISMVVVFAANDLISSLFGGLTKSVG